MAWKHEGSKKHSNKGTLSVTYIPDLKFKINDFYLWLDMINVSEDSKLLKNFDIYNLLAHWIYLYTYLQALKKNLLFYCKLWLHKLNFRVLLSINQLFKYLIKILCKIIEK